MWIILVLFNISSEVVNLGVARDADEGISINSIVFIILK